MTDSILNKYAGRRAPEGENENLDVAETPITDDLGCFGWLRGSRERAVMVELRKKDGNILAVPYGWLERAAFDPSVGITLQFGSRMISIKGRNLNAEARPNIRLFNGLARHKIAWVQEADEPASIEAGEQATVIDSIEW